MFLVPTPGQSLYVETPWPGLLACGDWIGHPSPALWMERCCVTGIAAANHVLESNGAEPFPLIPPREPEELARFLERAVLGGRRIVSPLLRGGMRLLRRAK
jgi:isorenieratene synthase